MIDHDALEPEDGGAAVTAARSRLAEVLQELDDRQATVKPKRGRENALANARGYINDAKGYVRGAMYDYAAKMLAFAAAALDQAEGRAQTEALNDRWDHVRSDLPETLREKVMPERVWASARKLKVLPKLARENPADVRLPRGDQ